MNYDVDYEICAAIFLFVLFVISSTKNRLEDFQSKMFKGYLIGVFSTICLAIITCYTIAYYQVIPLWLNYVLNSIFLGMRFLLPTIVLMYVYFKVQRIQKTQQKQLWIALFPAMAGVALMIINIWTKDVFYFDATGYHQGSLYILVYVNALVYVIGILVYTICVRKILQWKQCVLVISIVLLTIVPTAVQFFFPRHMLSDVGAALAVFLMYLTNENLVVYIDSTTGALNREAFAYHNAESGRKGMPEQIFVIALDNFKIVNEVYGMEGGNRLMQQLVVALQKEYSELQVFRFGGDTFAVTIEETTEGLKELDRIQKIIHRKWMLNDAEIQLSACICLVHSIHHDQEELVRAIEYGISKAKAIGKGQFLEISEQAVDDMQRKNAIEQAIMTSIEAKRFEVHFQPIYDVARKRFHSMEALARLQVPGYGYVSPEEFIRIAEQNGTIMSIGMLVLEEVCRFIKESHLKEKGIEFVEVNLSVVQCMQEKIHKEILEILERYDVEPSMINLEITESAAAYSEERLIRNMARLSLADITFSLDDYGSGYSNVNYLVDLPFSIVKIDKYIVWAAVKKVSSRKVLESMVAMFKAINLKVVAEGIEDSEMLHMLVTMGADYIQGYYFSKPLPKEKVLECLEEGYLEGIYKKNAVV